MTAALSLSGLLRPCHTAVPALTLALAVGLIAQPGSAQAQTAWDVLASDPDEHLFDTTSANAAIDTIAASVDDAPPLPWNDTAPDLPPLRIAPLRPAWSLPAMPPEPVFASISASADFSGLQPEPVQGISATTELPDFYLPALDGSISGPGFFEDVTAPTLFNSERQRAERARVVPGITSGFSFRGIMTDAQLKALIDRAPQLPGESPRGMPLARVVAQAGKS